MFRCCCRLLVAGCRRLGIYHYTECLMVYTVCLVSYIIIYGFKYLALRLLVAGCI